MSQDIHTVENFFGVYLLYCKNPKYLGRVYVGYTVDPNRRIKQHNKGKHAGGAWKTSKKGPWDMVMIIHGFPNDIAALRFEWAWQHPHTSRRLKHVAKKKAREKVFDFHLRVLSEMLLVGPWNRLPLTIRWLKQEYARDFSVDKCPPIHMPICYGPVISKKLPKLKTKQDNNMLEEIILETTIEICTICKAPIEDKILTCLNVDCDLKSHLLCLSAFFLSAGEYVPIEGRCPSCSHTFLWGDIVRKYKGCYDNLDIQINLNNCNDFYSSDSE